MRQLYSFYSDAFWIAVKSILEHKLRAFLTLIGIIIGVAAVVVVGASISGLKTYVIDKVAKVLGANHFMITRLAFTGHMDDDEFERKNRLNKPLTWEEFQYIKDNCRLCEFVGADNQSNADLEQDAVEMPSVQIQGSTDNMYEITDKTITEGRFFTAEEVERAAHVTIIGTDVQEKFFPYGSPLGKILKLRGVPLTVIGIEDKRGSFFGQTLDRDIYIPITLYQQIFNRSNGINVHGKAANKETFQPSIEEARQLLRNRRQLLGSEEENFSLVNVDEFNTQMDQFTGAIAAVVIPITMIILVVGGIVVMNIMLVSVTERTFEVGLRKAIGATRSQILLQFLIESALLCILGGIMGLIVAIAATQLVGYLLAMTMTITFFYVILSVAVSSIIGILAGLYPAWKAARLDPIVALTKTKLIMTFSTSLPREVLAMAIDSVLGHKFRSFLTILGIVVGVMTAIVVASILTGMRQSIVAIVEEYGTNNIYAFHLSTGFGPRNRDERNRKPLTDDDANAILAQSTAVQDITGVAPSIGTFGGKFDDNLVYEGKNYRWALTDGVEPNYAAMTNLVIKQGRFISEADNYQRRNVLVVGVNTVEALFPDHPDDVVGKVVRMNGRTWEIIGVIEKRKAGFFGENEEDRKVLMPYRTARKEAPERNEELLIVQAKQGQLNDAVAEIEGILRQRRGVKHGEPDNFDIKTADNFIAQFDGILGGVGLAAIAISCLGLLVGGIGVMNIMLVSVTERTKEIGIRKAIGATRFAIILQFLLEAMTLTFFGGVMGVTIAVGISNLILLLIPSIPAQVPLWAVLTGLFTSVGVGLIFGVFPAWKAARLDPIDCLRYE